MKITSTYINIMFIIHIKFSSTQTNKVIYIFIFDKNFTILNIDTNTYSRKKVLHYLFFSGLYF